MIPYSTKISLDKKFRSMLILCIGRKISLNLISPTVRVAHQEVVGPDIKCTSIVFTCIQCTQSSALARSIYRFLVSLVLACCTPFIAALASAMAEGNSSDDRDPAGSGKTRGATWKYDSSDIKLGYRSRKKRF